MILVKLRGGLCNQMFQYAAALSLARRHHTKVLIDISWFNREQKNTTPRNYGLHNFNITSKIATHFEIIGTDGVRNAKLPDLPVALWRKIFPKWKFTEEKFFHFDPSFFSLPDNVCLWGYWISEKYFIEIRNEVRKEFTFRNAPDAANQKILDKIKSVNAVSLHIRRGDYVNNPEYQKKFTSTGKEYYYAAAQHIASKIPDPHFFIFSDEPRWAHENISLPFPFEIIAHNTGENDFEDLRLMSACRHHILTNSSFSWWGAWLNNSNEKIVIAPRKWFSETGYDENDLLPESWIKM